MDKHSEVFVTYDSTLARQFADVLRTRLKRYGFRVFVDESSLQPADGLISDLEEEIERATAVVIVLSSGEEPAYRHWVAHELTLALRRKRAVIPVLLEDGEIAGPLESLVADRQKFVATRMDPEEAAERLCERIRSESRRAAEVRTYSADVAEPAPPGFRTMQDDIQPAPRRGRLTVWATVVLCLILGSLVLWFEVDREAPDDRPSPDIPPPKTDPNQPPPVIAPPTTGHARLPDVAVRIAEHGGAPGIDLSGIDCTDCTFRDLDFRGTILNGAVLRGADLAGTDFMGAQLRGSDLRGANLKGADLSFADLRGARLDGADLTDASFQHATLTGASYSADTLLTDDIQPYLASMFCELCDSQ